MAKGTAKQIMPNWADNIVKERGHGKEEADGILLCGGSSSKTCEKVKFGEATWKDISKPMKFQRLGDASSSIMGGIFVTGGKNSGAVLCSWNSL